MKTDLINIKLWTQHHFYPQYKTAIIGDEPYLHKTVTRVNYLTASLWLEFRNNLATSNKELIDLPAKPNRLVMIRNFRRGQDKIINHTNN